MNQIYTNDGYCRTVCIPIRNKGWFKMELQFRSYEDDLPRFKFLVQYVTKVWIRGTNVAWSLTLFPKYDWSPR